jgi:ribosomal protein L33
MNANIRLVCPECGNDTEFLEVADDVVITTRYLQNDDCSFTQDGDESQVMGEIKLFCAECSADLSEFHQHFLDMLF